MVAGDASYQEAKSGSPYVIFGSGGEDWMGMKMMYDRHHAFRSEHTVGEGKDDGHAEQQRVGPSSEKG